MRGQLLLAAVTLMFAVPGARSENSLFSDDFSSALRQWQVVGHDAVAIRPSGNAQYGPVLELRPNGDVLALIRGSDAWSGVRVEGEMYFPTDVDNYLGFAAHAVRVGDRWDVDVIYVKGNESYLQANPQRDFNVGRALYPEFRTSLVGSSAIVTARWQRFAFEVLGRQMHVYVGDTSTPQMTIAGLDRERGLIGLQPRSVGGEVWVDNLRVRAIDRMSYDGPPVPAVAYDREGWLTQWRRAGPFSRTNDTLAARPDRHGAWVPVAADARGAVVTGRDVDYHGARTVAYYRTTIASSVGRRATLVVSTVDDLAVWVNGRFHWFVPRRDAAWHDALTNPARAGQRIPVDLRQGSNDLIVRVRGGVYASGGFYAGVVN